MLGGGKARRATNPPPGPVARLSPHVWYFAVCGAYVI
eukprot:gene49544-41357_t